GSAPPIEHPFGQNRTQQQKAFQPATAAHPLQSLTNAAREGRARLEDQDRSWTRRTARTIAQPLRSQIFVTCDQGTKLSFPKATYRRHAVFVLRTRQSRHANQ